MSKIIEFMNSLEEDISDIHLREGEYIYIRENGSLRKTGVYTEYVDIQIFIEYIKFNLKKQKNIEVDSIEVYFREGFDLSFGLNSIRYRLNGFMFSNGRLGIVIRKNNSRIKNFKELGLPQILENLCNINSGLFIISGPTGSGKTSTLAAILEYINENLEKHVITIEDPIEYVFKNKKSIFTQREIGDDFSYFSDALKNVLRQDPDIVVIGEVRDEETLKVAIKAAETGHLCICTMHTLGSVATIDRIIDLFESDEKDKYRAQLSMVLKVIFSQQLVSTDTGNSRIAVTELLTVDKSVQNMIRENKLNQISNHILINSKNGMILMDNELINLYEKGIIDIAQLEAFCIDGEFIKNAYRGSINFRNGYIKYK